MGEENENNEGGAGEGSKSEFKAPASQEEFDRMVAARLDRERSKFADYDDLKKKAAEHDKAIEATKTEHEKAVEAARAEGRTEERTRSNSLLLKAKAEMLAAQARFKSPGAVVASLDLASIKVDDAGAIDTDALQGLITKAAESGAFVIDGESRKPAPKANQLKSGSTSEDNSGMTGKDRAAAALRQLRGGN